MCMNKQYALASACDSCLTNGWLIVLHGGYHPPSHLGLYKSHYINLHQTHPNVCIVDYYDPNDVCVWVTCTQPQPYPNANLPRAKVEWVIIHTTSFGF